MEINTQSLIGYGIYSIPEASGLIGLPTSRIRRWLNGYSDSNDNVYKPVLSSELPKIEGKQAISFHDLLELRFIKEFLDQGVSLTAVREASRLAAEILKVESHPFITHAFMTDRKSILHSVDKRMLNLNHGQYELEGIIKQSLFKGFIYSDNIATAWHPSQEEKSVILDPSYSLGKPINERTGIRTRAIFHAWSVEGEDSRAVASMFGLKSREISEAVQFEQRLMS
jgi:uncharacterized protein (DUF433 family)